MLRTVREEPCSECGVTTNAYDRMMGRLCPKCIAIRCAQFGKSLEMRGQGKFIYCFDEVEDMHYLAHSNKSLLEETLIDHSNDIDSHIHKTTIDETKKRI